MLRRYFIQLKRETDYALRILLYIGQRCSDETAPCEGVSIFDISSQTGIPRIRAGRICGYLKETGLIRETASETHETLYAPGEGLLQRSLLDIIAVTEYNTHLFAVFDRQSQLYRSQARQFQKIEAEIEEILSNIPLQAILQGEEQGAKATVR